MKLFFVAIIALIVPAFFLMMFVQGTCGRLTALRSRCRDARAHWEELRTGKRASGASEIEETICSAEAAYRELAEEYESLRRSFPARWVAAWFGFEALN